MTVFKNIEEFENRKSAVDQRILEVEAKINSLKSNMFHTILNSNFWGGTSKTHKSEVLKLGPKFLVSQMNNRLLSIYPHPLAKIIIPAATDKIMEHIYQPENAIRVIGISKRFFNWLEKSTRMTSKQNEILEEAQMQNLISKIKNEVTEEIINIKEAVTQ